MALAQAAWPHRRRFGGLPLSNHTGGIRLAAASRPGKGAGEHPGAARAAQALRSTPGGCPPVRLQRRRPHSNARKGVALALTLPVIAYLPLSPESREKWLGSDLDAMVLGLQTL